MNARASKRRKMSHDANEKSSKEYKYHRDGAMPTHSEWQGWAEIESDPAFFSVMLRELGTEGLAVREIFSLEKEMLEFLPRPVYGVIFLFRWKEDEESVDTRFKAGSKVWFANQTASNACASYALLNIVNNIPKIYLGPQLEHFREFTKDFTPSLRGDALANFEFVKRVHNSFARDMDKLNGDLFMNQQVHISDQNPRKLNRKGSKPDEDTAHHFIAFMPIHGVLWKMDGLEWQPRSLGKVKHDDWLEQIKSDIESRMSRYEEGEIEFAILGVVKDPLHICVENLAANVKSLQRVKERLSHNVNELTHIEPFDCVLLEPDPAYNLTDGDVAASRIPEGIKNKITKGIPEELVSLANELSRQQTNRKHDVMEEQRLRQLDEERVSRRRHDCGQAVRKWLQYLVRKQAVRQVLEGDI